MLYSPDQRRAFFAKQHRLFPLRGQGHRAQRNRVIVATGVAGLGIAGGIAAREALPTLFRPKPRFPGEPFTAMRAPERWEHFFLRNPATRRPARHFFGAKRPGGRWMVSDIPPLARLKLYPTSRKGAAPQMVGRPGFLTRRAEKAEKRTVWNILGKTDTGEPRLYRKLEAGEQAAIRAGRRTITRLRERLTEPYIPWKERRPGGKLHAAKELFRKQRAEELRGMTLLHTGELRKIGHSNPEKEAAALVERYVTKEAKLKVAPQFPSVTERISKRVVGPVDRGLARLDRRLNLWAMRKAHKAGLPVWKRRVNLVRGMDRKGKST